MTRKDSFRIFKKDWQRASKCKRVTDKSFHFRINSDIGSSLRVNAINWSRKMSWRCTIGDKYAMLC